MTARSAAEQQAHVDEDIELTPQFVDLLIQDESIWDEMPAGATVFLYREGDQKGEARNRRAAEQLIQQDRLVYVRALPPTSPAGSLRMRFHDDEDVQAFLRDAEAHST